ncbi:pectin acetylesterase 5-like [Typha angustifolia]|uniref:pectin acetylesterase 5-like n=1 Tax=Typha angustifolia TaxID=59011 RepID=UPI003C2FB81A
MIEKAASAILRRLRVWWSRGGVGRAAVLSGFAVLLLAFFLTFSSWIRTSSDSSLVDLTLLSNAEEKGALCLDGSPPGYHLQRGSGSGSDSWLLNLEGGGWCNTLEKCSERQRTPSGSSHYMNQISFVGILSNNPLSNPDFYNWNKVMIRYCDGASFSGDVESDHLNGTQIFFRGMHIWEAVINELLTKGLINAKQAFLTGCSAGGLATFIHCDDFRALLPKEVIVKCLSDGGFFLDEKDISGKRTIKSFYNDVIRLQNVEKHLLKDCLETEPAKCFFPEKIIKSIKTPFFILNSAYDSWQISNVLVPEDSDPENSWARCKLDIHDCDSTQIELLQGFRMALLNISGDYQHNRNIGMFINSCFAHCQTYGSPWHSPISPRINNKTIAEAVGDWYFNRRDVKEIDCAYPCNPTCDEMESI